MNGEGGVELSRLSLILKAQFNMRFWPWFAKILNAKRGLPRIMRLQGDREADVENYRATGENGLMSSH